MICATLTMELQELRDEVTSLISNLSELSEYKDAPLLDEFQLKRFDELQRLREIYKRNLLIKIIEMFRNPLIDLLQEYEPGIPSQHKKKDG